MEHFIEGILEFLFSFIKNTPQKRPAVEYRNNFIVHYNKTASIIKLSLLLLGGSALLIVSFFMDHDTKAMFLVFFTLFLMLFFLFLFLFSVKYCITPESIRRTMLFLPEKKVLWNDITCVRTIEKTDDSNVTIALYNQEKKCVLDLSTDMENAWYIVEMAKHKNIEIREEKDLTVKQIRSL